MPTIIDALIVELATPSAVLTAGEFTIPVPDGGRWIGAIAGEAVLVRTFVD